MKYSKDKVEAAKILFAEILELNQELPEDREIYISISGGQVPMLEAIFWHREENGDMDYGDDEIFREFLEDTIWEDGTFAKITAKMQEWKELYCK